MAILLHSDENGYPPTEMTSLTKKGAEQDTRPLFRVFFQSIE